MKSVERFFNDNLKSKPLSFRDKFPFQKRLDESTRIMEKYPDRVPIICEKWGNDSEIPDIDRKKYLVPKDLTVTEFIYIIRKRLYNINPVEFTSDKALYFFVNGSCMPITNQTINMLYEKYKDDDKFLYVTYAGESTFG